MACVDYMASIIERLAAARGEMLTGPGSGKSLLNPAIGLASLELTGSKAAAYSIGGAGLLSQAAAPVIAIVGMNPVGRAVAEFARSALGAEVVFCNLAGEPTDHSSDMWRYVVLEQAARIADIFCVTLPWAGVPGDWLVLIGTQPLRARTVIVARHRSPAVERALAYLVEHVADEVSLSRLAAHVALSKFHLVRLFKAIVGITPHRCQLLLRLYRARTMLRQGTGIVEVALALGFCDQAHLNRTFRLLSGAPSSQYQPRPGNFFQDLASGQV